MVCCQYINKRLPKLSLFGCDITCDITWVHVVAACRGDGLENLFVLVPISVTRISITWEGRGMTWQTSLYYVHMLDVFILQVLKNILSLFIVQQLSIHM